MTTMIKGHATAFNNNGTMQRHQRLGGVLNFYYRMVAWADFVRIVG